jgi:glyoxylase-like metal-dependent hydrolase (beta-lactamase superfamily II)
MIHVERIRLSENLYVIPAPNQSRFPFCNSFLITGKQTVLIDTGIGKENIRAIDKEKRIDVLIISHSHPDHIVGWETLEDRFLLLPKETPDSVKDLRLLGRRFTETPEKGEYWTKTIANRFDLRVLREPDKRYGDGDILDFGNFRLKAVHAPGHLNDHYCFTDTEGGALITTDIDFTSFGPWYGNPECDIGMFQQSIRKVMALPHTVACSSHKLPIFGHAEEDFKAFLTIFDRQRKLVHELYNKFRSLEKIVDASPFYRHRVPDNRLRILFETVMVKKNLALLIRDGLIPPFGEI